MKGKNGGGKKTPSPPFSLHGLNCVCHTDGFCLCTAEKAGVGLWEKFWDVFLSSVMLQNGDAIAAFIW